MKLIVQFFTKFQNLRRRGVVLYSGLGSMLAGLFFAFLFALFAWDTVDSIQQDTTLMTPGEARVVYFKRALFGASLFLSLYSFCYSYSNSFDPVSIPSAVSSIPPSVVQPIIQSVSTYTDTINLFANKLGLTNQFVFQTLADAKLVSHDKYLVSVYFDAFFKNVHNLFPEGVDFSNVNLRASFVRALIRYNDDPEKYQNVFEEGVARYLKSLDNGETPASDAFLYYVLSTIFLFKL